MPSNHAGCVPPTDSSASTAPMPKPKIPIARPKTLPPASEKPGGGELDDAHDDDGPP